MDSVVVRDSVTVPLATERRQTGAAVFWASYGPLILAAGLTVVALGFRLVQIGSESLWLDEAYTLLFSRLPLERVIAVGGAHEHPPVYYLLVHAFLGWYNGPLTPRVISAVAGALSVLALYALGALLYSRRVGLVAAGLLAVSSFELWHSQDGRGYALAGFFVLLSYLSVFGALKSGRRIVWLAYVGCTCLAIYTEYSTALALFPQVLLAFQARRIGCLRRLILSWTAILVLYIPWLAFLIPDAHRVAQNYWMPAPTLTAISGTALEILGLTPACPTSTPCVATHNLLPPIAANASLVALISVAAVLLVILKSRLDLTRLILLSWLLFPFAAILLVSLYRPLFVDRVFTDAAFPLFLLIAQAVFQRGAARWIAAGILALLGVLNVYNSAVTDATRSNGDWKGLMAALQAAYRPGQAVAYYPGPVKTQARAYVPTGWRPTRDQGIWVSTYLDAAGLEKKYGGLGDNTIRPMQLKQLTAGQQQVWLVTDWYVGQWELHYWLYQHGFHIVVHQWFGGDAFLELWGRRKAAAPPPTTFAGWSHQGWLMMQGAVARTKDWGQLTRAFLVSPHTAYSVRYQYQGQNPDIAVLLYPSSSCTATTAPDLSEPLQTIRPIGEEGFSQHRQGPWQWQPFGFVPPAGIGCAVVRLRTWSGSHAWRNVSLAAVIGR